MVEKQTNREMIIKLVKEQTTSERIDYLRPLWDDMLSSESFGEFLLLFNETIENE